jgi:SAM-dependent methyltransferase
MDRALYNQLVPYYETVEGRDWQNEIRLIASILKDHKCKSVIDLGCGTGYHVRALTKLGFKSTGIDISKHNIQFARDKATKERGHPRFVVGSYYEFRPDEHYDAALCLNWSIPVRNSEVKCFLDNTHNLLRPGGYLIFDFERISQIVWSDVGKVITGSWDLRSELVVRVSVGQMVSNVLSSRDVYLIYSKTSKMTLPNEKSRYRCDVSYRPRMFVDKSYVRFFSISEIRSLARRSGFKLKANFVLPRNTYKRNYAVLKKM